MKQLIVQVIIFICLLSITSTPVATRNQIRVGVYNNPPLIAFDDRNEINGLYADVLNHIAAKEKWELTIISGSWDDGLQRLKQNEIEVLVDIAHTEAREANFYFNSESVLSNWGSIFIHHEDDQLSNILDLDKKTVAILKNDVYGEKFKLLSNRFGIECRFIELSSFQDIFTYLDKKLVDAGVVSRIFGNQHKKNHDVKMTSILFQPIELKFASGSDQNQWILDIIDRHLVVLKDEPGSIYYASINKLLGGFTSSSWNKWLILSLIAAIVSILALTCLVIILRYQAQKKRAEAVEFKKAKESAESMSKHKSDFLAHMSHEIRTPLNAILGFTDLLHEDETCPNKKEKLSIVTKAGRNLLAVINDILDFSKIEAGKLELTIRPFSPNDAFSQVHKMFLHTATNTSIDFNFSCTDLPSFLLGDEQRLCQLLINLLGNAFKFTEKGQINCSINYIDDQLTMLVSDTGIGIAEHQIPRIFDSFNQIDNSMRRKADGTGLGLTICKKIINKMNGTISVDSILGAGTTFTISIPLPISHDLNPKATTIQFNQSTCQ